MVSHRDRLTRTLDEVKLCFWFPIVFFRMISGTKRASPQSWTNYEKRMPRYRLQLDRGVLATVVPLHYHRTAKPMSRCSFRISYLVQKVKFFYFCRICRSLIANVSVYDRILILSNSRPLTFRTVQSMEIRRIFSTSEHRLMKFVSLYGSLGLTSQDCN